MKSRYYILQGQEPIEESDTIKWAKWFESTDRTVEYTKIEPGIKVSTVFLGINHQFGKGPPILFETMIFGGDFDECGWRYSTWDEAVEGHRKVVESFG